IGENHVAHGLMIFDVAGAAAEVTVERLGDGFLKLGARNAFLFQPLEQDLTFVKKACGAVAALKGKVSDEGFLQDREFAVLGMALYGADRFAVKARRRLPFGFSFASTGGSTSISRSCSGRSEPRATRYCPSVHLPLPGPSSYSGSNSRTV